MPIDRPTFSETWFRVAELKPKLRPRVQIVRQEYRGQIWYVVRDLSNNQFFRLDEASHHFVGMLDGRRTVEEVWNACNEQLGDRAPTQGEVIQLLGQLYTSNLLQADLPPDAEGMFDRYRKRVRREFKSHLGHLLFVRIPLIDPERFLDRWKGVFSWAFGPVGVCLWLVLLACGFWSLMGRWDELFARAENVLAPDNIALLYISFALIKAVHEFGHGFACKRFGQSDHTGGEVHTIGIMLLVFMPVPYVDASSAWAFRNKWHRAFVGFGGMYVELAVAAVAAMVWAATGPGTIHAIAYNMIFVAGVSTILFNGNPLIRFDGYYILSDILETPNLYQRSRDFLYYLVKRYVYGVRRPRNPAHTSGERFWLLVYAVASSIYRVFLYASILLFVSDKMFFLGVILACVAAVMWLLVPVGKWLKYLATSQELARCRPRAIATSAGAILAVAAAVGLVPMPDRGRAQGVVEPSRVQRLHMGESGFVEEVLASGTSVEKGDVVVEARNRSLETRLERLRRERRAAEARLGIAMREDRAGEAQSLRERLRALGDRIRVLERKVERLRVRAPFDGRWVAPKIERKEGAYLERGERLGLVAAMEDLIVRATADQGLGPRIDPDTPLEIRVKGRPEQAFSGSIRRIVPAGQRELPSPALGYKAGGGMRVAPDDRKGTKTVKPFFELRIQPGPPLGETSWRRVVFGRIAAPSPAEPAKRGDAHAGRSPEQGRLLSGQRVVVRFELPPEPLALQWYHDLRQLVQERFQF